MTLRIDPLGRSPRLQRLTSFGPAERTRRENHIKALVDEIDKLAKKAKDGSVQYLEFEELLGALHAAGFFPQGQLVSDVAHALEAIRL